VLKIINNLLIVADRSKSCFTLITIIVICW